MIKRIILTLISSFFFILPISAQSLLKNGEIPKDLVITLSLSGTIQFAAHYDLKITSDGRIYLENMSGGLPINERPLTELLDLPNIKKPKATKKPKLRDKLSKTQLRRIIAEIENSGFSEISRYYESVGESNMNDCSINHVERKGLSITVNGRTAKAFFFKCYTDENSPVKRLFDLYDKIERELSGVKRIDNSSNATSAGTGRKIG